MNAGNKAACGRDIVSIRDAAWVLGVGQPAVSGAIRRGVLPLARRRGRVGVPAVALAGLLCPDGDPPDSAGPGTPGTDTATSHTGTHHDHGDDDHEDDDHGDYGGGVVAGRPGGAS
jgi:hypothetical protein